jgi:hypothetical protein
VCEFKKRGHVLARSIVSYGFFAVLLCTVFAFAQERTCGKSSPPVKIEVSFKSQILPIFKRQCLPCHAEDNFNPSNLSLDSHELLLSGGKHGATVVPGKASESILFQKIGSKPPFGDRMPLDPKKRRGEPSMKSLSQDEITLIGEWIDQGAKGN